LCTQPCFSISLHFPGSPCSCSGACLRCQSISGFWCLPRIRHGKEHTHPCHKEQICSTTKIIWLVFVIILIASFQMYHQLSIFHVLIPPFCWNITDTILSVCRVQVIPFTRLVRGFDAHIIACGNSNS
jgi:hypothetical protein